AMNNPLATLTDRSRSVLTQELATLRWYCIAFKNYEASLEGDAPLPSNTTLQDFVIPPRDRCILPFRDTEASELFAYAMNVGRRRHQCAASRRRTSALGMVFTTPLSSSATHRFTSVARAASASWSTVVPRLSSSDPARAARASVGSPSASFSISAVS